MKKILIFAIIISILLPILTLAEKDFSENEILLNILDDLGGELQEVETSINGVILKKFLEKKGLNNLVSELLGNIGIMEFDREEIYGDGYSQINLYSYDKNKNPITMIISSYSDEDSKMEETYLYINLINKEHFLANNDIIIKIGNIFKDSNSFMEITSSVIGYIDGNAWNNQIEKKATKALRKHKGHTVHTFKDINLLSYTAYTPRILKDITIGEEKINLNLPIRYNDYEDKTLIWIGTPIITSGY